jgi:hypothetical protein
VANVGGGVNLSPKISPDGYVSVTSRFDDSLLYRSGCRPGALVLDQNLTLHLYQEQWEYVLEHRSQVSLVVVYSWNEYFERSFIEPAYSYTDPGLSPYYLLNLTANYTHQLRVTSSHGQSTWASCFPDKACPETKGVEASSAQT